MLSLRQQHAAASERQISADCTHAFIAQFLMSFQDIEKIYFLFEFLPGGELLSVIQRPGRTGIPVEHAQFYLAGVH